MSPSPDQPLSASFGEARAALVQSLQPVIHDQRVLDVIARVPREQFVPNEDRGGAYEDRPLSIGHGQTISQPRMVALMLQELRLQGHESVLEVGAGSGYQAALLSLLARQVVSVDIIPSLASSAASTLARLGYDNVQVQLSLDQLGWPAAAPYDAIIVAAAAPRVPQALVDQLGAGGRLVLPVGTREEQDLLAVESLPAGLRVTRKGSCRFVPLIGPEAYAPGA